jgi:hypothetical protein
MMTQMPNRAHGTPAFPATARARVITLECLDAPISAFSGGLLRTQNPTMGVDITSRRPRIE